jgi:hypothetical protein
MRLETVIRSPELDPAGGAAAHLRSVLAQLADHVAVGALQRVHMHQAETGGWTATAKRR